MLDEYGEAFVSNEVPVSLVSRCCSSSEGSGLSHVSSDGIDPINKVVDCVPSIRV